MRGYATATTIVVTTVMKTRLFVHRVRLVSSNVHKSDSVSHSHKSATASGTANMEPTR